jgi:DNA mismatch endonuclease (patch repair protein)
MRKRQKEVIAPRFTGLPSSELASRVKQLTPRRDTKPEMQLRRALWSLGLRYRIGIRALPGRPDIVFARARVVVFCDGDFWHGKDWRARKRKLLRGANSIYWVAKIESNIARDKRTTAALEANGWRVIRLWESDVVGQLPAALAKVVAAVRDSAEIL